MTFSERLSALMRENGYTNYRLAKLLNCSQATIANWIGGNNLPVRQKMSQLADLFGVSVEYLKGETDDKGQKEKPTPERDGLSNDQLRDLMELLLRLSPEHQAVLKATAQALLAGQSNRD